MSMKLSERLLAIAMLVPQGSRVIDVGTDHAKLPVWLAKTGRASHVWASDINEGPLKSAKEQIEKAGVEDLVGLRLTDGLCGFTPADGDVIVIAGMGGETIVHILSEAPWVADHALLILEPQSRHEILRKWLCENGFRIRSESLVEDAGRLYPILTARGGEPSFHTGAEYYTGLFSLICSDPLYARWLSRHTKRAENAAPYDPAAADLLKEFHFMKERLDTMPTVGEILSFLNGKAPMEAKLSFDNVGLLVGRSDRKVSGILTALDITDEVIEEAIAESAELIVSHHPLFFELKSVSDATWTGSRALSLAEHGIAAICMHTNLDAARGGVNDALLDALSLKYDGELDEETMIGRVGVLTEEMSMQEFLAHVKTSLHANGLRYHDAGIPVRRVAVCGGSGGGELSLAHAAGCDTYVTADIKYDPFLEAKHLGMNLIDADHFCTENVVVPVLRDWLTEAFPGLRVDVSRVHGQTARFS